MKKLLSIVIVTLFMASILACSFVSAASDNNMHGTAKFLKDKFNVEDANKEFKVKNVKNDELGYKHVKLQQVVDGIPVYDGDYIVHFDNNGNIYSDNGNYNVKAKNFKGNGKFIKANDAIEIAKADVNFKEEAVQGEEYQADLAEANLYLYNVNNEYVPVYLVRINWLHEDSFGDWRVFVNANTGAVVDKYNAICHGKPGTGGTTGTPTTGTGTGVLGDTKTINLIVSGGTYSLVDKSKPMTGTISTYNAANGTRLPGTLLTDIDTIWNSSIQKAAVDAHFYAGSTYDFYKNLLGRNSIDGNGMTIKSTVHYSRNYVNAFWNGTQMVYGDGDGVNAVALSGGLDVVAHELTHGVTSYECDLEYRNQSGALNEAFSDIFGTAVEFTVQPTKADWLVGEDIWTPAKAGDALRSMSDPTIYGDPDHMSKYVNTTDDNGGVHTNSGIPNKAAYLVGSKIGTDKMAKIYYRASANYMTITTNFSQCRAALLQSATDLYGAGSVEYNAIVSAFDAVGIH